MSAPTTTVPTTTVPVAETAPVTGTVPTPAANSTAVQRLAAHATEAAAVRALTTHPDMIALRVERIRSEVDGLLWAGIVLGLAFTMVNVQTFAATGAARFTAGWWVAWSLDPMVSLVLLAVLRAEQVTARYQVPLTAWGRRTKWLTFAATYVMNTWTSWGLAGSPFTAAGVVLHSVPPLVVFATAETGPGLRDRLTEAVHRALSEHHHGAHARADAKPPVTPPVIAPVSVGEPAPAAGRERVTASVVTQVHEPSVTPPASVEPRAAVRRAPVRRPSRPTSTPPGRRLLGEYVTAARTALDTARAAGEDVDPSPAWCRRVTGCSAGTSVKVAAALRAADPTADPVQPVPAPPVPVPSARREEAA